MTLQRLLDAVRKIKLLVAILVKHEVEEAGQLHAQHLRAHRRPHFTQHLHRAEIDVGAVGMGAAFALGRHVVPEDRRILVGIRQVERRYVAAKRDSPLLRGEFGERGGLLEADALLERPDFMEQRLPCPRDPYPARGQRRDDKREQGQPDREFRIQSSLLFPTG